jgi:hypothetical protein
MPPPKSCRSRATRPFLTSLPVASVTTREAPRRCPRRPFRALGIHTARFAPIRGETPALEQQRTYGNRHAESRGCGQVRGHGRSDAGPEDAVRRVGQHPDLAVRCVHAGPHYARAKPYSIVPCRSVAFPHYRVIAVQ